MEKIAVIMTIILVIAQMMIAGVLHTVRGSQRVVRSIQ